MDSLPLDLKEGAPLLCPRHAKNGEVGLTAGASGLLDGLSRLQVLPVQVHKGVGDDCDAAVSSPHPHPIEHVYADLAAPVDLVQEAVLRHVGGVLRRVKKTALAEVLDGEDNNKLLKQNSQI